MVATGVLRTSLTHKRGGGLGRMDTLIAVLARLVLQAPHSAL
jgi:hypothetical protein